MIYFISSAYQGDIIEMGMKVVEFGHTSLTLHCEVRNKLTHKVILKIDKLVLVNLDENRYLLGGRVRREGGGRKSVVELNEDLENRLKEILSAHTMGDPERVLLWTGKSLRNIEDDLKKQGINVSHVALGVILQKMGFSLQGNRKTDEGGKHEDRNDQFETIDRQSREFLKHGYPVISVDCKKKENIGNFKNGGREWAKKGQATDVRYTTL